MTKFINPGLAFTSRRDVLRGSVLASAAAMVGSSAMANPRRSPMPMMQPPVARFIEAEAQAQVAAAPADLSGYTRVKQELVAPPFAPLH
jgi:nitrite reductase (NO-forming)